MKRYDIITSDRRWRLCEDPEGGLVTFEEALAAATDSFRRGFELGAESVSAPDTASVPPKGL